MSAFEELGVCPDIIRAIEDDGWLLPTSIQGECIPYILNGQDVCAAAETGSGKTGAFGLPCLQIVHENLRQRAITSEPTTFQPTKVKTGFNLADKNPFVMVTEDGREAKSEEHTRWSGIRCHEDIYGGKYQFEVLLIGSGLVRVGVSTSSAALELGTDSKGWGYGATGKRSWNGTFENYGGPYKAGDVIGVLVDLENLTLSFACNGDLLGVAYDFPRTIKSQSVRPHVCGKGFHVRIYTDALRYPIEGYTALAQLDSKHSVTKLAAGLDIAGKGKRNPLLLVLEPTRDLAIQTHSCMVQYAKYLDAPSLRITLCVGGIDERKQRDELQQGTDIVVGTLQKVSQWENKKELTLDFLKFLVLDEADDLIKNDEHDRISRFKRKASCGGTKLQTLFFSATLHSNEVRTSIQRLTSTPVWVDLKGKPTVPETVHAVLYHVDPKKPLPFKVSGTSRPPTDGVHMKDSDTGSEGDSQRVKVYKPQIAVYVADKLKMESCMIFCRTNLDCDNFEKYLISLGGNRAFSGKLEGGKENPYSCVVLAGMRQQEERVKNLQHFKDGDVRFLICTDVAARGIDIKELPHLIMLSIPDDVDQWFHRVGRVGRADNMGLAISLIATCTEKVWYHKCASRGRGCSNTNLVDQGGCCIWYDEPSLLKSLTEKLGQPIPAMDPLTLTVPGILKFSDENQIVTANDIDRERKMKQGRAFTNGAPNEENFKSKGNLMIYGRQRDDESSKQTSKRVEELLPTAIELAETEKQLQILFVTKPVF